MSVSASLPSHSIVAISVGCCVPRAVGAKSSNRESNSSGSNVLGKLIFVVMLISPLGVAHVILLIVIFEHELFSTSNERVAVVQILTLPKSTFRGVNAAETGKLSFIPNRIGTVI